MTLSEIIDSGLNPTGKLKEISKVVLSEIENKGWSPGGAIIKLKINHDVFMKMKQGKWSPNLRTLFRIMEELE
jgi:hypothetical protein